MADSEVTKSQSQYLANMEVSLAGLAASLPAGAALIGKVGIDQTTPGTTNGVVGNAGENHLGAIGGHTTIVTVTPTLTVHATYAADDYVGTSADDMAFAVGRVAAGTGTIISATLIDYALQSVAAELWLFSTTVTAPDDSAPWSISDADALKCIGVIPFSTYYASALNSISMGSVGLGIPFVCGAASQNIFGCLVTRGAPTYADGDVSIRLGVLQD